MFGFNNEESSSFGMQDITILFSCKKMDIQCSLDLKLIGKSFFVVSKCHQNESSEMLEKNHFSDFFPKCSKIQILIKRITDF